MVSSPTLFDFSLPLHRHQLTFAQTADELQIEHWQDAALVGCRQIGFDLFRRQDLHFVLWNFRRNAVVCRIANDQSFFDRPVERIVQHRVNAADRGITQPRMLPILCFAEPSVLLYSRLLY